MISRAERTERHMIDASTSRGRESSWMGVRSTCEFEISLREWVRLAFRDEIYLMVLTLLVVELININQ